MEKNQEENQEREHAKKNDWFKAAAKTKWKAVISELHTSKHEYVEYLKVWEPLRTEYVKEHEFYCGIDTHKKSWRAAIYGLDREHFTDPILGPVTEFEVNAEGRKAFLEMIKYFGVKRVLMEVSGVYTFPLYDLLSKSGLIEAHELYVMNPRQIPRDLSMIRKTDKTDAMRLARVASRTELLTSCYIETKEQRALRALVRLLKKKVQEKNRYENRLKGLMAGNGFVVEYSLSSQHTLQFLKAWTDSPHESLADFTDQLHNDGEDTLINGMGGYSLLHDEFGFVTLNKDDKLLLGITLSEVVTCKTTLETMSQTISQLLLTRPQYKDLYSRLLEIPGIGEISAAIIVTESGPLNRFSSVRHYQAYCGLAPKIYQSGETIRRGTSYKMSNRRLFFAYKQAAMAVVNYVKRTAEPDLDLDVPLYRYAKRFSDSGLVYLKTVHKVAAKICRIVYSLSVHGTRYSDRYSTAQPSADDVRDEELHRRLKRLKKEISYFKRRSRKVLESRFALIPKSMQAHLGRMEELSESMLSEMERVEILAEFELSTRALEARLSRNPCAGGKGA